MHGCTTSRPPSPRDHARLHHIRPPLPPSTPAPGRSPSATASPGSDPPPGSTPTNASCATPPTKPDTTPAASANNSASAYQAKPPAARTAPTHRKNHTNPRPHDHANGPPTPAGATTRTWLCTDKLCTDNTHAPARTGTASGRGRLSASG